MNVLLYTSLADNWSSVALRTLHVSDRDSPLSNAAERPTEVDSLH